MKEDVRVIISGGGTGGHIYPAIAIANEIKLRYPDSEILFVGAEDRMEMQKVPEAGYRIEGLPIIGIQRKLTWKNLVFPLKLIKSLSRARKVINKFKPDVVIGTGGFASGPLLQMANQKNIPTLVQEQNSLPGITNKLLARKAKIVCTAYPGMERFFPADKIVLTGNPLRQDLLDITRKKEEAFSFFKLKPGKKVVLVLGGSLGARKINELIEKHLPALAEHDVQLLWQTGSLYYDEYKAYDQEDHVQTLSFLNRMDLAYAAADIIISRGGAGTVSELCLVGKPVVFIPSPNVAEDHQTKNALAIVKEDAAIAIAEKDLEQDFEKVFFPLLESQARQDALSANIRRMARPHATAHIVDQIEKIVEL